MTDTKAAFTLDDTFTAAEATALVDRLRATFRTGHTKPLAWRRTQLTRLRDLLTDNRAAIADALYADLRKNRAEADAMEIDLTIVEIDDYLEHLEEWTTPQPAPVTVPGVP
ncbi:aldehyde dehydrogenase family protein, partial [Streptomyces sp. uw30]